MGLTYRDLQRRTMLSVVIVAILDILPDSPQVGKLLLRFAAEVDHMTYCCAVAVGEKVGELIDTESESERLVD